jgi:hypothetical protein
MVRWRDPKKRSNQGLTVGTLVEAETLKRLLDANGQSFEIAQHAILSNEKRTPTVAEAIQEHIDLLIRPSSGTTKTYQTMLDLHIRNPLRAPQAGFECAQRCTACAEACLSEDMVAGLTDCIRTSLDCVDVCVITGKILSRHGSYDTDLTRAVMETCRTACKVCADECGRRASMHRHCHLCADACRRCEQACADLLLGLRGWR